MASKEIGILIFFHILALTICHTSAFPTPAATEDDKILYNRQLTEERPLQEQIAEADVVKTAVSSTETNIPNAPKEVETAQENDDFAMLKSLAEGQRSKETNETPQKVNQGEEQYISDESDSTKNRRVAEDYDSTKNGMDYGKYQDDPESFRQVDGTPLTAEDIVQKIANKIYEEDDRGVFDRIVSKLLKLGLITDSQADTLEYQVAEALQDLITKNAKNNEIDNLGVDYPATRGDRDDLNPDANMDMSKLPSRQYNEDEDEEKLDNVDRDVDGEADDTVDHAWDRDGDGKDEGEPEKGNELSPEDGLQDLQYFPNFYRLLRSLDSEQDAQERETLITIMKTLIDFVKMMVKYGTITPEEGVSYLENLDAMIAMQTKNKLGKSLGTPDMITPTGKNADEDDNTKAEAAKLAKKEYENLKDSTKQDEVPTETNHPGKSETYLEAIRKNIEWLKKHNKDEGKDDYDLSKLRDFMDQQVDSYIEKGIIEKGEGETIKRIYGSL